MRSSALAMMKNISFCAVRTIGNHAHARGTRLVPRIHGAPTTQSRRYTSSQRRSIAEVRSGNKSSINESFENPSIIKEFNRSKRLPPGTGVRILTFTTYGLTTSLAIYCVLYLDYRDEESEDHCFSDIRRWFVKRKAEFLGIDQEIILAYDEKTRRRRR